MEREPMVNEGVRKEQLVEQYGELNALGRAQTAVPFEVKSAHFYEEQGIAHITFSLPEHLSQEERDALLREAETHTTDVLTDKLLYEPRSGDTLMVHIPNPPELARSIIDHPQITGTDAEKVRVKPFEEGGSNAHVPEEYDSVEKALAEAVRIDPIEEGLIRLILGRVLKESRDAFERNRALDLLRELDEDTDPERAEKRVGFIKESYSVGRFLSLFPSARISLEEVIEHQRRLGRRTYDVIGVDEENGTISIAVSVRPMQRGHLFDDEEFSEAEVENGVLARQSEEFPYGASVQALLDLKERVKKGKVVLMGHIKRYAFGLPEEVLADIDSGRVEEAASKDIMFIGVGVAGLAVNPLVEERQRRAEKGEKVGKIKVFTGKPYADEFQWVAEELDRMGFPGGDSVLESIDFAATREEKTEGYNNALGARVHTGMRIGQVLIEQGKEIWRRLDDGAYILINGTKDVAESVKDALATIVLTHACTDEEKPRFENKDEARAWVDEQFDRVQFMEVTSSPVGKPQ